jgi:hypothetical protein
LPVSVEQRTRARWARPVRPIPTLRRTYLRLGSHRLATFSCAEEYLMRPLRYGLLVLLIAYAPHGMAQEKFKLSDGRECGLEGTAKSEAGKAIDRLKNRFVAPTEGQFDLDVSLVALLAPGDDLDRFDQNKGAQVSGFVIDVKVGGIETCNCRAKNPVDRDTHIELGLAGKAPKTQRVIVEVTPRIRAQMKAVGKDWSTDALGKDLKGKWVKVTGWLLFDTPHINEAENTHPGNPKNWRATCWEIHPVTGLDILDNPPANGVVLHHDLLATFHRIQRTQFERDSVRKAAIHTRNRTLVGSFDKEDLDEDVPK